MTAVLQKSGFEKMSRVGENFFALTDFFGLDSDRYKTFFSIWPQYGLKRKNGLSIIGINLILRAAAPDFAVNFLSSNPECFLHTWSNLKTESNVAHFSVQSVKRFFELFWWMGSLSRSIPSMHSATTSYWNSNRSGPYTERCLETKESNLINPLSRIQTIALTNARI